MSRPTVAINPTPAPKHAVVDFADLAAYPELPYLQIEHDLESPKFINTDALYRFEQLETLVIEQPIDIDLSQLPALKDLRMDYNKKNPKYRAMYPLGTFIPMVLQRQRLN
ncbi:hypothetical protein [Neisseria elongata]|uniref:hypothetical protein n=1 Tax=Neisseria elongata TaxID=495 RepID=UPI00366D0837